MPVVKPLNSGARAGRLWLRFAVAVGLSLGFGAPVQGQTPPSVPRLIKEGYPTEMAKALEAHEQRLRLAADAKIFANKPLSVIVPAIWRWKPGTTLTVAFSGGTPALYQAIEDAASVWTAPGVANIKFKFRDAAGGFNTWSVDDTTHKAHIRIAFDQPGYWSSIGTGSIDPTLPGGAPYQGSMNLGGFARELPDGWKGIVRHEFGHALGFRHEHQSPVAGCDFRYFDDADYEYTFDSDGWYTLDAKGRRPGLYTFLSGKANYWDVDRVDANLKPIATTSAFIVSAFDRTSIMKYHFDAFEFEKGVNSPCYTGAAAQELSGLDMKGARTAYPADKPSIDRLLRDKSDILGQVRAATDLSLTLKESTIGRLEAALQ